MPNPSSSSDDISDAPESAARPIEAVLFDYGMVLSGPPDPSAWAALLAVSGLDEATLRAGYWGLRRDYDRGALTGAAYWDAVAAQGGVAFDEAQRAALMAADIDQWSVLNRPMVEWARRLQRAGVRTGILSNIGDSIAQGIVARLPWLAGFDHCAWSYAMSMAKPDPAIYLRTAQALKTAPGGILFIDDLEQNVAAAAQLGMQTLHYTTHPDFEREMRRRKLDLLLDAGVDATD